MTLTNLRHRLEYAVVLIVRSTVAWLPDRAGAGLGSVIGAALYAVDGGHRRLTIAQLRAAFPTRSPAACRLIARATFGHLGRLFVAVLKFSVLTSDQIGARVEYDGVERVREALAGGKGVLLFSGHFGFWELQGMAHPLALPPMSVLARRLDNPYLHRLLERARTATGNGVIYRRGAVRRVLRALQSNECVAIMIDQHVLSGRDAVTVDFFGRPASTVATLAALALRTNAPVIPVFALPLAGGRYRCVYEHPVPPPAADVADPIGDFTQRCTDVLEMYVRHHPHLWLWMHRRWRDDVTEAPVGGMFPAAAEDEPGE